MNAFFNTPERLAKLASEVSRWNGTRWMHCGAQPNTPAPGVAGDCLCWVHILKACGHIPADYQLREYRKFDAIHGPEISELQAAIAASGYFEESKDAFHAGDILLFRTGNGAGHAGIVTRMPPAMFAHLGARGWVEEPLDQKHLLSKFVAAFRPVEVAP